MFTLLSMSVTAYSSFAKYLRLTIHIISSGYNICSCPNLWIIRSAVEVDRSFVLASNEVTTNQISLFSSSISPSNFLTFSEVSSTSRISSMKIIILLLPELAKVDLRNSDTSNAEYSLSSSKANPICLEISLGRQSTMVSPDFVIWLAEKIKVTYSEGLMFPISSAISLLITLSCIALVTFKLAGCPFSSL